MILVLATMWFFQSKFYYKRILDKKHPSEIAQEEKKIEREKKSTVGGDTKSEEEKIEPKEKIERQKKITATEKQKIDLDEERSIKASDDTIQNDTIWIETEKLRVGIDEKGGNIISAKTIEYTYLNDNKKDTTREAQIEIIPQHKGGTTGGANLSLDGNSYDNVYFEYKGDFNSTKLLGTEKKSLVFRNKEKDIEKVFTFYGDQYKVDFAVRSNNVVGKNVKVGWKCGIAMSEKGEGQMGAKRFFQRKMHVYGSEGVGEIPVKNNEKKIMEGYYKWVSVTEKYFLVSIINDSIRDCNITIDPFENKDTENNKEWRDKNYSMEITTYAKNATQKFSFFIGPGKISVLKNHGEKLHKTLFGGIKWFFRADIWFPYICEFILMLLIWIHAVVSDYGIVILILTVITKAATFPMTHTSMKSMNRMKDIQPKVQKIKNKHNGDPQKMNQEIMALYKKEGVNPMNPGCLPMFLQMPIWISLFVVLRKAIELRGEATFLIPWVNDLAKPEAIPGISPLPFSIPMYGSNVGLLAIIMAVLMFFQNKMTMKDPNQKAMIYVMPVMMLLIFNNMPAGLVLYITFSNLLQILQQKFITQKR